MIQIMTAENCLILELVITFEDGSEARYRYPAFKDLLLNWENIEKSKIISVAVFAP